MAHTKTSPAQLLTHSDGIFDFIDFPPDAEVSIKITGPISQPYLVTIKTDHWGSGQLIWRTQAAGDYRLAARGQGMVHEFAFSVAYQAGEEDLLAKGAVTPVVNVQTVAEEPAPTPPKPRAQARGRRKRATS